MDAVAASELIGLIAAAGADHGEHGLNWWEIGSMATNFVLFFGFIYLKLKGPVKTSLEGRRTNMEKQLEEAQAKQRAAEAELAEYKAKLENLGAEVERVVKAYEAEARSDAERMKSETEKAIQRLARESEVTIEQEVRKAEALIRKSAVQATLEAAEALIKNRITDADQRRLVDQYVSNLEKITPSA